MKTSRPCLDFHVPLLVSVILLALSLKVSSQRKLSVCSSTLNADGVLLWACISCVVSVDICAGCKS